MSTGAPGMRSPCNIMSTRLIMFPVPYTSSPQPLNINGAPLSPPGPSTSPPWPEEVSSSHPLTLTPSSQTTLNADSMPPLHWTSEFPSVRCTPIRLILKFAFWVLCMVVFGHPTLKIHWQMTFLGGDAFDRVRDVIIGRITTISVIVRAATLRHTKLPPSHNLRPN